MNTKILQSGWPTPVDHHLRPLIDHLVAVDDRGGGHVGGVGGGDVGLGHRERRLRIRPSSSGSSHCAPLLVGAVLQQHLHVAGVGGVAVEDVRRERRAAHQLGDRGVVDVGEPLAAVGAEPRGVLPGVLRGQEEVPQPLRAGLGLQLGDQRQRLPDGVAAGSSRPSGVSRSRVGVKHPNPADRTPRTLRYRRTHLPRQRVRSIYLERLICRVALRLASPIWLVAMAGFDIMHFGDLLADSHRFVAMVPEQAKDVGDTLVEATRIYRCPYREGRQRRTAYTVR